MSTYEDTEYTELDHFNAEYAAELAADESKYTFSRESERNAYRQLHTDGLVAFEATGRNDITALLNHWSETGILSVEFVDGFYTCQTFEQYTNLPVRQS